MSLNLYAVQGIRLMPSALGRGSPTDTGFNTTFAVVATESPAGAGYEITGYEINKIVADVIMSLN